MRKISMLLQKLKCSSVWTEHCYLSTLQKAGGEPLIFQDGQADSWFPALPRTKSEAGTAFTMCPERITAKPRAEMWMLHTALVS